MQSTRPEPLTTGPSLRVVGIGASAGGVEAFSHLLKELPTDSGMAFVLLSHLSPTHSSELAHIFSPLSRMPVQDAVDGASPEPNHVYILPPNRILTLAEGRLRLTGRDPADVTPSAIDQFLESLAIELGPLAVGVILSGTGSDGTAGLRAIKAHGGITYAQDPTLAAFEGMPRSAVESGAVDFTFPLEGIALAIAGLGPPVTSAVVASPAPPTGTDWDNDADLEQEAPELSESEAGAMASIIRILQSSTGVDFLHYKRPSLIRRVRRRAEDAGLPDLVAYLARLRDDPAEVTSLFQTVLVQVTRFFRESKTFEVLQAKVIPALTTDRKTGDSVRVWVVGCATGEEVYSLAIAFMEVEAALGVEVPVRIFASDVSDAALAKARLGCYPESITTDVASARVAQFFAPVDQGYQVNKRLREMCVFARHDITRDPPFAQLDLVLCCNVLIYLDAVLQRRLLQNMHYALKPGGYLLLGPAETTTGVEGLFAPFDQKHKIYRRRVGPARLHVGQGASRAKNPPAAAIQLSPVPRLPGSTAEVQRVAEQVFFSQYPTASVIVNQEFDVLHYQGPTSPYLQAPTGGPTAQVLRLAHPDLQLVLGRMLRRAKKDKAPARQAEIHFGTGRQVRRVNLSVLPIDHGEEQFFLVVFDAVAGKGDEVVVGPRSGKAASRLHELEAELAESKEYLQTFIDQQDAAHAELQAAYEASLSVTEEFQSTNEELESAKEELQSLNEELTTVNEQVQHRNAELMARSAEVTGLLEALDMPLLLITRDRRIRAFNARAAADFHLNLGKVGRELGETSLPVSPSDLIYLIERAFEKAEVQELELQDKQGRWQAVRVWPVHSGGETGTAAIAFIDIARLKRAVSEERELRAYSEAIVETVFEPLVVLDGDLRILRANTAFHRAFGTEPVDTMGKRLGELGRSGWDMKEVEVFLERTHQSDLALSGAEVALESSRFGERIFRLSAGRIGQRDSDRILLALEDMTERKRTEAALLETSRMQAVGQLAGGVAHEINNQMTVVLGLAQFLIHDSVSEPGHQSRVDLGHIVKAAERSAAVSQQLLAFSRRLPLQPVLFDLNTLVGTTESLLRRTLGRNIELEVVLGSGVGQVRADQAQLEQVLVNLGLNARDAMEGKGSLKIETTTVVVTDPIIATDPNVASVPAGKYARLIVSDSGSGMDPVTMGHIFEPFFTTKPIGQGTGLGLASVYGVVSQSGGSISVESEPGEGTTFTIDLPQVVPAAPSVKKALPPLLADSGGGTEVILVIDDEEIVREWVTRSLRRLGYVTLEARNADEALGLIAQEQSAVDLVLSDVLMPGIDGAELRTRLAEARPGLPVLLMSGFGADDLISQGKLEPGTVLLQKPFTADTLGSRVREVLDRSYSTSDSKVHR